MNSDLKGQLFFAFESHGGKHVIAYFPVAALQGYPMDESDTIVFKLEHLPDGQKMPNPEDAFLEFLEQARIHNSATER